MNFKGFIYNFMQKFTVSDKLLKNNFCFKAFNYKTLPWNYNCRKVYYKKNPRRHIPRGIKYIKK